MAFLIDSIKLNYNIRVYLRDLTGKQDGYLSYLDKSYAQLLLFLNILIALIQAFCQNPKIPESCIRGTDRRRPPETGENFKIIPENQWR